MPRLQGMRGADQLKLLRSSHLLDLPFPTKSFSSITDFLEMSDHPGAALARVPRSLGSLAVMLSKTSVRVRRDSRVEGPRDLTAEDVYKPSHHAKLFSALR